MKKILFLTLLIIFGCNQKSQFPWSEEPLENLLANNTDKIIFIDFYSDT